MSNSTFGTPLDYTVDLNALGFSDTGPGEFTIEVPVMENHLYEEENTCVLVAAVTRAVGNMVSEVWLRGGSRSLSRVAACPRRRVVEFTLTRCLLAARHDIPCRSVHDGFQHRQLIDDEAATVPLHQLEFTR